MYDELDNSSFADAIRKPTEIEAEQCVLSCLIQDHKKCVDTCITSLSGPEVFYDMRHQIIYEEMIKAEPGSIELSSLAILLKNSGNLETIGGIQYLTPLVDAAPSTMNLSWYINRILEAYTKRRVIEVCEKFHLKTCENETSSTDILNEFEESVMGIRTTNRQARDNKTIVHAAIDRFETYYKLNGKCGGITTGFMDFDTLHDGLHEKEVIIIAGYPGTGKTVLAMDIAKHVALVEEKDVGVFSLEMADDMLMTRMICSEAKVDLRAVRNGKMAERDFPKITNASAKLRKAPIHIHEMDDPSIEEIRAEARRMKRDHDIKVIIVDYLQLVTAKGKTREEVVARISRNLKRMAKELKCCVIALSQLNDDGKLRESRAIGQDADSVTKLHQVDGDAITDTPAVDWKIVKQRNGPAPCNIELTFLKEFTSMEARSKIDPSDYHTPHND